MENQFTAETLSKCGHSGTIQLPDELLHVTSGNPLKSDRECLGPDPEQN